MTDAGWAAVAQMVTALCAALAAIFAHQAKSQSKANEQKLDAHEEASAERGRLLKAEMKAPGGRGGGPI